MATIEIPHIAFVVDDNNIDIGALEILKVIRPTWNPINIEFKLLTDGITNKLVSCKNKDEDVVETVLVRVYGNKTDLLIDRKAETRNILLLNKVGLAPKLYATFTNGLAYQFIPGCTLTDETVTQPHIYRLVAQRLARVHKVQVPENPEPQPVLWTKLDQFLNLVPDVFSDSNKQKRYQKYSKLQKSIISKEIAELKKYLCQLDSPIVFAHNDLLLGNVIYTKEKNCVTFIDYEYAAFNYQAFDIGNHFAEFVGLDNVDYRKYPNKELQIDWFKSYLTAYQGSYNDIELEKMYVQVNQFSLITHIFWGIWALIQAEHSYINFDFLEYAAIRFDEYFNKKDEFLALELPRYCKM